MAVENRVRIILASASPRRRELMRRAGLAVEIMPSQVEETASSTEPGQVVQELAFQKAEDVASHYAGQDVVVLGADTVVSVDGEILGKPKDEEDAVRMLKKLQGRVHQVYTGVCMKFLRDGEEVVFSERTDVSVCAMAEREIWDYVATGESMDKAGAYGIQGRFGTFISGISGDYNNVVGLPTAHICRILRGRGLIG